MDLLGKLFGGGGGTRYPIKHRVTCFCPGCNREVPQERSVYPDVVYFTCMPNHHHWKYYPVHGEPIPGGGVWIEPPKGYDQDEE